MTAKHTWNTELYEARHAFVWQMGQGILDLLQPRPGERILDVGCGTGQLAERIAQAGADVLGFDASPDMIGQARQNYPNLKFALGDAAALAFEAEFDAVFSNAALHWIIDQSGVASGIFRSLKPGGRFVAEFGGKGNIGLIEAALRKVLPRYLAGRLLLVKTHFPSLAEYAGILEASGFEVTLAQLFDRPTPLEGEQGMQNWLRQFSWYNFEVLAPGQREQALAEVVEVLRPSLYRDGVWTADYRRLRIVAIKPAI